MKAALHFRSLAFKIALALMAIWPVTNQVQAGRQRQDIDLYPCMLASSVHVAPEFVDRVRAVLRDHQPEGDTRCYAITSLTYRQDNKSFTVSMAAFSSGTEGAKDWQLENAAEMFTLIATRNEDLSLKAEIRKADDPLLKTSGGSYRFPWQSNTTVMYGDRKVHDAGYGLSGWMAVDLVSDSGSGHASSAVYAASDGTVDYICKDNTSMAIRLGGTLYAHLVINNNIEANITSFTIGQQIGTLVVGSFNDTCGWATNAVGGYHLHWGFPVNSSGEFSAGGCTISVYSQIWTCGSNRYQALDWIPNSGATSDDGSGVPSNNGGGNFWGFLLSGALNVVNITGNAMPGHDTAVSPWASIVQWAGTVLEVVYVAALSQFDMTIPFFAVTLIMLAEAARLIYAIYMLVKNLVPAA